MQNGVAASGAVVGADFESQVEQACRNVLEVLRSVGATQENVVKQTILVAKGQDIRSDMPQRRVWGAHPIALTVHIVDGIGIPGALVGIEAVCALGE
jgi:2-iminobutanoate/2-iminopropanoate deaminase